jgi:hypothetical protein
LGYNEFSTFLVMWFTCELLRETLALFRTWSISMSAVAVDGRDVDDLARSGQLTDTMCMMHR